MKKFLLLTFLFFIVAGFYAETVYVKISQAELKDKPAGKKTATILKGAELQKVYETGEWTKVILEGWIKKSELSKIKPRSSVNTATGIPLSFKILEAHSLENKSQVKVEITNISSKTITSAQVVCKALDGSGNIMTERSAYVVFPNQEPLKPQETKVSTFILDVEFPLVNSFAMRIGKVKFEE